MIASLIDRKMTPAASSSLRKVVATDTLSNTASTATRRFGVPSAYVILDPRQHLLLAHRNAQLFVDTQDLGIDLVEAEPSLGFALGSA